MAIAIWQPYLRHRLRGEHPHAEVADDDPAQGARRPQEVPRRVVDDPDGRGVLAGGHAAELPGDGLGVHLAVDALDLGQGELQGPNSIGKFWLAFWLEKLL